MPKTKLTPAGNEIVAKMIVDFLRQRPEFSYLLAKDSREERP